MVATRTRWRLGFTLVELLVVIAILSLLLSLLAPTLSRAKDQVRVTVCISNTGQFSKAMSMYCDHNKGRFWLFNHISCKCGLIFSAERTRCTVTCETPPMCFANSLVLH